MVVPYAAPEFPHSRKFAFDVCVHFILTHVHVNVEARLYSGEYGMGTMANELSLGCDV